MQLAAEAAGAPEGLRTYLSKTPDLTTIIKRAAHALPCMRLMHLAPPVIHIGSRLSPRNSPPAGSSLLMVSGSARQFDRIRPVCP